MNRTWKFVIVIAAISMIAAPALAQKGGPNPYTPHGEECFSGHWTVIANGSRPSDVSVAGTLAGNKHGRLADLLYVAKDRVPKDTENYLQRFSRGGSTTLYVIGGLDAVSQEVVEKIMKMTATETVRRVDGDSRYQTAAIASRVHTSCK